MMYKIHQRPMMLLEAMIAFALVVLCTIPLISPHTAMLKAQRQFIRKIDLDHAVNLLYAFVLEQLYMNTIGWNELTHRTFPIYKEDLQRLGSGNVLGYEGSYQFHEVKHKPNDENAPYFLYLLTLTFNLVPSELSLATDEVKKNNTLKYSYEVFVVRDKRPEKA
ncbi:MAG: type II secretion system protein [Parachlamydia sp.]|nr:type II secretion system protein [Parachlamydia sp.]